MILTAEEAKKKICAVRQRTERIVFCRGTECMSWRCEDPTCLCSKCDTRYVSGTKTCPNCEVGTRPEERGFCGLAGRPEP